MQPKSLGPRHRQRVFRRRRLVVILSLVGLIVALATLTSALDAHRSAGKQKTHTPVTHPTTPVTPVTTTTLPVTTTTKPRPKPVWRVAWGSAMAWGYGTANDVTVRDLATVGVGGEDIRVRISNVFGNLPLDIGAATVGRDGAGPTVVPGTLHALTFGGVPRVTVPIGQVLYSDPVSMSVQDMETLAISVFVPSTDLVSVHPCCAKTSSYFTINGGGDLTGSLGPAGFRFASPWYRWVDAVDVLQTAGQGSIVVVGDSITDGFNSTLRWTDVLQQRIDSLPASEQRAVINEGIAANALTSVVHTDDEVGGGPSGLSRLARDALDQPGVSEIVLFLGTNDLWFGATAQQLIAGYEQAVAEVHKAGLRIVAVTLLPRATNREELWTVLEQGELVEVDQWITTSGVFDGVLNLASAVADVYDGACEPDLMFPPYDSGDHLHPDAAGETAMADAVNPSVLELPALPQVPPLVSVTPTAGCRVTTQ